MSGGGDRTQCITEPKRLTGGKTEGQGGLTRLTARKPISSVQGAFCGLEKIAGIAQVTQLRGL